MGPIGRFGRMWRLTLPGCWGAVILACLSFTPSLLPRGGPLQGIVCGITAAIGYGLGVLAAWIWRAFADRPTRIPSTRAWRILLISAVPLLLVAFGLGQYWQYEIRRLMGVTDDNVAWVVAAPLVALLMFGVLLLIGRGVRRLYRRLARFLDRWIGPHAAAAVGWMLAACLVYLFVTGILLEGLASLADKAFSVRDTITEEGITQPATSLRSGGPDSLVAWDTLGRQGRNFAGSGPAANDIQEQVHLSAKEPIRAYAGLASSDDTESRAQLAVSDLERAGGFERTNLLVVTTTGSGWVDPALVDSFEYLSGGDAATVAIQYSYLPSWISYLVDQTKAREAGRALFDAVYEHWLRLPQDHRPKLYVAGESLGSFGGETAFSGEYDLRNRTAGTLFVGPPNFNTLFRDFSDHRDTGSPEIEPVYRTATPSASPAATWAPFRSRARHGKATASSTSCTRPTPSSGGAPTSSSTDRNGSASHPDTTSSTPSGCLSSPSGRSPRTCPSPPESQVATATNTRTNKSTGGTRSCGRPESLSRPSTPCAPPSPKKNDPTRLVGKGSAPAVSTVRPSPSLCQLRISWRPRPRTSRPERASGRIAA